jgi:hypothetical protein
MGGEADGGASESEKKGRAVRRRALLIVIFGLVGCKSDSEKARLMLIKLTL